MSLHVEFVYNFHNRQFIAQFNQSTLFLDGVSKLTFVEYEIPVPWGVVSGESLTVNCIALCFIDIDIDLGKHESAGRRFLRH